MNQKFHETLSRSYFNDNDYEKTKLELKKAKNNALNAYAQILPSNIVEGRTLWLDRSTITSVKTPEEMANLFERIKQTGINLVYFETVKSYSCLPRQNT